MKNAAGYDLCRLLTGSLGTLAVITQVTLMVKPMPETAAVMACDVGDFDAAERLLAAMVRTETLPVAVEMLAGPAWRDDPALGPMADGAVGRLVVGFEGSAPKWTGCSIARRRVAPVRRGQSDHRARRTSRAALSASDRVPRRRARARRLGAAGGADLRAAQRHGRHGPPAPRDRPRTARSRSTRAAA